MFFNDKYGKGRPTGEKGAPSHRTRRILLREEYGVPFIVRILLLVYGKNYFVGGHMRRFNSLY